MVSALGTTQAQISNTVYVNTFPGSTVGDKTTNAQLTCSAAANLPCIVVFDPSLSAYPVGTMPAPCAQCIWQDHRASVAGTLTALSVNGIVNAASFPGPDIGAQVNAAIAAIAGCGQVVIPPGIYRWTTPIIKPRCVRITGASNVSTILATTTITSGCALTIADAQTIAAIPPLTMTPAPNVYASGGIEDITLQGAGTSNMAAGVCIGDATLTDYADHQNFNRVKWINWTTAVTWGNNAWDTTIFESIITGNATGISFPPGLSDSGESLNVIGTSVQNNGTGLNLVGFGDFYFSHDRFDYNTTAGTVDIATFVGCHFEQYNGRMLTIAGTAGQNVNIFGGEVVYMLATGSDTDFFYVNSTQSPQFSMQGVQFIANHPVANILNWNGTGGAAVLTIGPLPNYGGGRRFLTSLTNATCNFWGCSINDGQGNLAFSGQHTQLSMSGDVLFNTITGGTSSAPGARLGLGAGNIGLLQGNGVGLRFDSSNGAGNTPVFLTNGSLNADGIDFRAKSSTINGGATINSSSNLPQTTATAPTGTCTPNGYIPVTVNGVTLHLATCP
jgi:hypothetical protein